jgi:hypothetical protein
LAARSWQVMFINELLFDAFFINFGELVLSLLDDFVLIEEIERVLGSKAFEV